MIRVLVADDHVVVREGIKRILADTPDLSVAGEASNGREVCAKVATQRWDVVLLDISMPGKNGLEVLHDLKGGHPYLPVLVFSMHISGQYAIRAFRAGALGYIRKDSLSQELVTAIRKVARGKSYVSPSLAEQMVSDFIQKSDQPLHASLSDRELRVLCLYGSGYTSSEIADELALSVKTIGTYRMRILEKLHLKSTAEMIHYTIRYQLAD